MEIMKRVNMMDCKSMSTTMDMNLNLFVDTSSKIVDVTLYRQMIGSLMYLMNTKPNICFVMNTLSHYLVEPRRVHLVATKHVMRYLKDIKITLGCCFIFGLAMTSWKSRKQSSISLSTVEAEYIAACSTSCESIWLRNLLTGLFDLEMESTMILCDN
jgi:hypothetical protein